MIMTSFLNFFLDSENLFQNDSDKGSFKDIKREIYWVQMLVRQAYIASSCDKNRLRDHTLSFNFFVTINLI